MDMHDRSERRAREILERYIHSITNEFSNYIESILLVGSLTNDSYVEGPGRDIDQVMVLRDDTPEEIKKLILKRIEEIENGFNNDVPIARTVYKVSEMMRPFRTDIELCVENKHLLEITTELFRIHESGIVLYGKNIILELPVPTREEVIYFNELNTKWSREEERKNPSFSDVLKNPPVRIAVQIVITNAFKHFYYATGKSCSNKHEIADRMKNEVKNYLFQDLLELATKFKMNPNKDFSEDEVEKLKNGCKELLEWIKNNPVYAVPVFEKY